MLTDVIDPVLRMQARIAERRVERSFMQGGQLVSLLASGAETGGQFALMDVRANASGAMAPPPHVHQFEDETFIVLEGQVTAFIDGVEHAIPAGSTGFLPRGIPHTFRIDAEDTHFLLLVSPAGFEQFFQAVGEPCTGDTLPEAPTSPPAPPTDAQIGAMIALAGEFGIEFVR